jgi:hypothetical protein
MEDILRKLGVGSAADAAQQG